VIPLKANLPAQRLAYITLAVGATSFAAWLALRGDASPAWALVFAAGNLVALWVFGSGLESVLGPARTLVTLAGATGFALAANALLGTPVHAWAVVSATPAVIAAAGLGLVRPRARVLTFSAVPLFAGVVEVPLAFVAGAWLAVEAVAVAAW
jgi:membrane associated rhomboid family serine protease